MNFHISVLASDKTFYDGECSALVVPTIDGQYGVMANHSNAVCAVMPGEMAVTLPDGSRQLAVVGGGIMRIESGDVLLILETIERPEEIDVNRAKREAEEAREAMAHKASLREYRAAQMQLARAIERIRLKERRNLN